ncbi:uncharacterized protein PFL1_05075 [Pseudozyma flocculosa PF-1]|uniref:Uncharacterized protein n=2 Tax=Pseudozyma flocculosa TaxID=84751 RepID=A0A5C3EUR2_9BASI|nr:uncharacterized protein PFL1_05075 [Pseudozyma flocculosa PF-1]EPQ27537.1 hypothetical protein PFL1_05075 [Pseudozyma flocculosa PF-1]SPO36028.1 uncharacterized protein PSFLO_01499 [Pseudozyma flocculosa]
MQQNHDSLTASAAELKRPSSSTSSVSDSQTLSRTRQARHHYARAARAFLQKDHLTALLESQYAANVLVASPNLGLSLSTGNLADTEVELARLSEKLVILRFTVLTSILSDVEQRKTITSRLSQLASGDSGTGTPLSATSPSQAAKQLFSLLSREPAKFISHLWFEALRMCSQTHSDVDVPSLEPSAETLPLAVELPASVVSAAILASLRLDDIDTRGSVGTQSARLISEWYLAAYSSTVGPQGPTERASTAYEKVVDLYAVHILATRLDEWEYAREFVGYSSLEQDKKLALLDQLDVAHAHVLSRPERESEFQAAAQKAYEDERARRAAAEKEAASASKAAQDLVKGVGSFLRGDDASATKKRPGSSSRRSGHGDASSGSESGSRAGYFSSSRGSSSSSSSTSASPAGSPSVSARSVADDGTAGQGAAAKRSGSAPRPRSGVRSASHGSGGGTDGEASDANASGRPRSHGVGNNGAGDRQNKAKEPAVEESSYASTRAHLSRYIENTGGGGSKPRSVESSRRSAPAAAGLLTTLKSFFDLRNAQSRSYLLTAIVMLFVFYRAVRRPLLSGGGGSGGRLGSSSAAGSNAAAGKGRRQESAAARNARNRLVNGGGSGSASTYGLGPVMLIWRKLADTVRMGTQVTYL